MRGPYWDQGVNVPLAGLPISLKIVSVITVEREWGNTQLGEDDPTGPKPHPLKRFRLLILNVNASSGRTVATYILIRFKWEVRVKV